MRFYVAARFDRQVEMREIAKELEAFGFVNTSTWLFEGASNAWEPSDTGYWQPFAQRDFDDLRSAETFILFGSDLAVVRNSKLVELGMALALRLRVICVGPIESIFHHLPGVERYWTWEEAKKAVTEDVGAHRT